MQPRTNGPQVDRSDEWETTRWGEYVIGASDTTGLDIAQGATILADREKHPPLDYFARVEERRAKLAALKARIPFLDINQERDFGYEGYEGMIELARQLALTLRRAQLSHVVVGVAVLRVELEGLLQGGLSRADLPLLEQAAPQAGVDLGIRRRELGRGAQVLRGEVGDPPFRPVGNPAGLRGHDDLPPSVGDGLAQVGQPSRNRIPVVLLEPGGFDELLDDERRRRDVGITESEIDDVGPRPPGGDPLQAAHGHPRRLQRARGADHVPALRGGPGDAESGDAGPVAPGAGQGALAGMRLDTGGNGFCQSL